MVSLHEPQDQDLSNSPGEPFDVSKEYDLILKQSPIMIFGKSYCLDSNYVQLLLLQSYQITPKPYVVELDKHPHGAQLWAYMAEVTGLWETPNVHVMGISRGGIDDFRELHQQNLLIPQLEAWGSKVISAKKLMTSSAI